MLTRKLLFGALTALAMAKSSSVARATTRSLPNQLYCYSPDDVTVEEIFVKNAKVKAGERLIRVSSLRLVQVQAQLDFFKEIIDTNELPFIDGRMTDLVRQLKTDTQSATAIAEKTALLVESMQSKYDFGLASMDDLENARISWRLADSIKIALTTHLAHADRRIADAKSRSAATKLLLEKQKLFLNLERERMLIKAPTEGLFVVDVGLAGFVKMGDILGRVLL